MKISAISGNKQNPGNLKFTPGSGEGVKAAQSFSAILENKDKDQTQKQLWEMAEKIKTAGNKLKSAVIEDNIKQYKDAIKEYLGFVLKNYHKLRHDRSINYSTVYTRVEIINKEVEELTQRLLSEEKDNIDVVAEVDKITGLILDVYS
ncbi:MAG: YaaR family protein [Bacillota bacterium]